MKEDDMEMKPVQNDLFELATRQMMLREQELEIEKQHIAVANKFGDKDIQRDLEKHKESEKTKREVEKTNRQRLQLTIGLASIVVLGVFVLIAVFALSGKTEMAGDVLKYFVGAVFGFLGGLGVSRSGLLKP